MRVIYYTLLEKPRGSMRLTSCTLNENSDFIVFNEKTLRIEVQFLSHSIHDHRSQIGVQKNYF